MEPSSLQPCPLFIQLNDYFPDSNGRKEWRETTRWVKFEETVEFGGNRWSKPHVGSMSLHYVFELRETIKTCSICLDLPARNLEEVCEAILSSKPTDEFFTEEQRRELISVIATKHRQQFESGKQQTVIPNMKTIIRNGSAIPTVDLEATSPAFASDKLTGGGKSNKNFLKKIPKNAETANILVGEFREISEPICAFVRLRDAIVLSNLTEVPVPTRFIFLYLGPPSEDQKHVEDFHEIGRAVGCIMSEDIFSRVAYTAQTRDCLLNGLESFLHELTVLPPGKWDPAIRVEPPARIPQRRASMILVVDEEEEAAKWRKEAGLVRSGKIFGGLINDIKRKAPFYLSDFTDAFSMQCVATYFFIYFACLAPIVTFGGLLGDATENRMAAMESLMAGCVVGVGYGLFAGQPLTIMGSTGPILVFETMIYNFCKTWEWEYLSFRLCIGIWVGIFLFILVALDASAYVCYITRFTEENFALLIAMIFIVKAVENIGHIGEHYPIHPSDCLCVPDNETIVDEFGASLEFTALNRTYSSAKHDVIYPCEFMSNDTVITGFESLGCHYKPNIFLMSVLLCLVTFFLAINLKHFRNQSFFPAVVRGYISDFAVLTAIIIMTLADNLIGLETPKLTVPTNLEPTWSGRGWVIHPLGNNPWWSAPMAFAPALLATILIFMDQQITSVIVNRKENKLMKGCGYHLDLFIVSILIIICSVFGLPWFVAATVLAINHVKSLSRETETSAPGDKPQFLGIREQRVTPILIFVTMGLSVFMTPILGRIPMPVLYGVFLYMGFASLDGLQFYNRLLLMFMPKKYQPDYPYLRKVPLKRVHLFTSFQIGCFAMLWIIKTIKSISILFPIMLVVMIGVRKCLEFVFTKEELKILDDILPEFSRRQKLEIEEEIEKEHIVEEHQNNVKAKTIVITNPATNLICSKTSIEVTLANGDVMTIPIEGNINVDVGARAENNIGTPNHNHSRGHNEDDDLEFGLDMDNKDGLKKRNNISKELVGSPEELGNLL